ncbi:MAG: hypothetical protein IJK99_09480 [Bacteroidales bacterium]|nr:hypothetical protein [Bacteroidales bacterium]
MKVYRIHRFGGLIREITGKEIDLLKWIQNNVPAQIKAGFRTGDPSNNKELLYGDARAAGITINSKVI